MNKPLVRDAVPADAEEILALQRLAYQSEAELYQDFALPPLTQSLEEVRTQFHDRLFLKATVAGRLVGSVRAIQQHGTCHIGRLVVHPDFQGRGIGTELMRGIEARFPNARRFELFTGHRSDRALRLYRKLGYGVTREVPVHDRLRLVYLAKPGPSHTEDSGCS